MTHPRAGQLPAATGSCGAADAYVLAAPLFEFWSWYLASCFSLAAFIVTPDIGAFDVDH